MIPLPENVGVGITSMQPLPLLREQGYDYRPVGIYHNYHVTACGWRWPNSQPKRDKLIVLEGFSPNLNKKLHVGHVKNLAIASSLNNILEAVPVAMLGASQGVAEMAFSGLRKWFDLARYHPEMFLDIELPPSNFPLEDGLGEYFGCKVFRHGTTLTVIYRSDGSSTYAAHDLSFAEIVRPDYYLTGREQHQHFEALGLVDKHLPMGLVLGKDRKKMRSTVKKEGEEANSYSADQLMDDLKAVIKNNNEDLPSDYLVWNIIAWQFNSSSRAKDTVLDVEAWANPASPGIYITYTRARIQQALNLAFGRDRRRFVSECMADSLSGESLQLCGFAEYFTYYWEKAIQEKEPCHLAQFALKLATKLSDIYGRVHIQDADHELLFALNHSIYILQKCMTLLGMRVLDKI